jgi:hypothetical protein
MIDIREPNVIYYCGCYIFDTEGINCRQGCSGDGSRNCGHEPIDKLILATPQCSVGHTSFDDIKGFGAEMDSCDCTWLYRSGDDYEITSQCLPCSLGLDYEMVKNDLDELHRMVGEDLF